MAMMSQSDVRAGAMRYYELLRQGTPAADAFRQAFPNGLPTAEERAREAAKAQAKAQQKGGLASIGGLAAGALGVKAVSDAVAGKPILGGVVDKITGWFGGEAANDLELVRGAIQAIEPGMAVRGVALKQVASEAAKEVGTAAATSAVQSGASQALQSSATNALAPYGVARDALGNAVATEAGATAAEGVKNIGAAASEAGASGTATGLGAKLIPGIGAALSAYGLFNANQKKDPLTGAISGAGLGSSIAALAPSLGLSPFGAPVLVGGALLGALMGGIGKWGDKDRFKEEYSRAQKLRDKGINWDFNTAEPSRGRSKEELLNSNYAADFQGMTPEGFVNNKFSQSRNEGDLRAHDIVGYSFLPEAFGNDYANAGLDKKLEVAQSILDAGAVREARGQMDFNENYNDTLKQRIQGILSGGASTSAPSLGAGMGTTPGAERLPMNSRDFNDLRKFGGQLATALGRADGTVNPNPVTLPEGNRIAYMAGGSPQGMQAPKMALAQPEEQQQIGARIAQALKSPAKFVPRGRFA